MKPEVKETRVEFMTRCLSDELTSKKVAQCELIWEEHYKRLDKLKNLKKETISHTWDVDMLLETEIIELTERGEKHDHTKLTLDALELLQSCLDGTGDWVEWNNYHFTKEDHHPEFWVNKTDMPLTAIMEMVADGAAAQYARGYLKTGVLTTFEDQKKYYMEKKGWGDEMATVLANQFMRYFNKLIEMKPYEEI